MAARLMKVTRANRAHECGKCRQPIEKGSPYVWWKFYRSAKRYRHDTPECQPTAVELESNSKRQGIAEAEAKIADAANIEAPADVAEAIREAIGSVEGVIEELDSALQAWSGTGLENGELYSAFENDKEALEAWNTQAEAIAEEISALDTGLEDPGDAPDPEDYEDGEEDPDYIRDAEEWDEQTSEVENCSREVQEKLSELEEIPGLSF